MTNEQDTPTTFLKVLRRVLSDRDALIMPTIFATVVVASVVVVTTLVKRDPASQIEPPSIVLALGLILPLVSTMVVFMTRYLSGTLDRDSVHEDSASRWRNQILVLERNLEHIKTTNRAIEKKDRDELVAELKSSFTQTASEDFIEELKGNIRESEFRVDIAERSASTLKRIYQEIDSLARRGTLNLVIGVTMAVSGIGLLGYIALGPTAAASNLQDLAIRFLPRLSVVVVIEVFSYFFLRLYKGSLDEIKYFQNEATNLELRFAALESAVHLGNDELQTQVVKSFLETDRNPLMNDGVTTRELAAQKLLNDQLVLSPSYLVEILNATSGNKK